MSPYMSTANFSTLARLPLLGLVAWLLYSPGGPAASWWTGWGYALAKGLCFGGLALLAALGGAARPTPAWLDLAVRLLVYCTVGLCVIRGAPLLLDIRALLNQAA